MNIENHYARTIYGIETHASIDSPGRIADLWKRFLADGLADEIPERMNEALIAVYDHYDGPDHNQFRFFVGCEVMDVACCADGFVLRTVPAGRYAEFESYSAGGERPDSTWEQIDASLLERVYETDFEIHDPETGEVRVFVGVRDEPAWL